MESRIMIVRLGGLGQMFRVKINLRYRDNLEQSKLTCLDK